MLPCLACRGQLTQWDVFMSQMEPLASQMPWMLTEGNHERDWPESGDRFSNLATDSGASFMKDSHNHLFTVVSFTMLQAHFTDRESISEPQGSMTIT